MGSVNAMTAEDADDDRCPWCGGSGSIGYIPEDGELGIDCPQCHGWGTGSGDTPTRTRCVACGENMDGDERRNGTVMCEECARN